MVLWIYLLTMVYVVAVLSADDCKDYSLTPADQSVIDMMKHYLHTSRKEKCSSTDTGSTSNFGLTYTRYGKKDCPRGARLVYSGQVGGSLYNQGGGVNYLCLPSDPENGKPQSYNNPTVYGAEYKLSSSSKPDGWSVMTNKEIPCAVCQSRRKSAVLMIPGRKTCYNGWTKEYYGYLVTSHTSYKRTEFVCADIASEPLDSKSGNEEHGALFYPIRTSCGSLRCPPYKDKTDVYCVVCSN